jgi:hypothetical protein
MEMMAWKTIDMIGTWRAMVVSIANDPPWSAVNTSIRVISGDPPPRSDSVNKMLSHREESFGSLWTERHVARYFQEGKFFNPAKQPKSSSIPAIGQVIVA